MDSRVSFITLAVKPEISNKVGDATFVFAGATVASPVIDDPDGTYLLTYNSLIVWPYDEEARILGEESWAYYQPDCVQKIDPAEAPEAFHRYVAKRRSELVD